MIASSPRAPLVAVLCMCMSSACGSLVEADDGATTGLSTSAGASEGTTSTGAASGSGSAGTSVSASASTTTASTTASTTSTTSVTTGASSGESETAGPTSTTGAPEPALRYHEVRQKSAHNSFQRHESLVDQLLTHRVRSLELDIHNGKSFAADLDGDWYVYHTDIIDDDSSCERLSECLGLLAAVHAAIPEHEVLTLWIDLKDDFDGGHTPADLDAVLEAALAGALVTPAALLGACPGATSLQAAVTDPGCDWPELAALRGRVIVALTGGDLEDPSGPLSTYVGGDPLARLAFVAPGLEDAAGIPAHPEAIFHNLAEDDVDLAAEVRAAGLVSRTWVLNDEDAWMAGVEGVTHHLATDKVNARVDPWASTASAGGWPFACHDACDPPTAEAAAIVTIEVESGDLWGSSDEAVYAHSGLGDQARALEALIAVPSSHVESWAKACLMARAGVGADAAYFAVCRPADDHPLRVQWRASPGFGSDADELATPAGYSAETAAFARLEVDAGGLCARGFGSVDGVQWAMIGERCFAAPLTRIGVSGSSHDGGDVEVHFVNLAASPGGAIVAGDLEVTAWGGAVASVVDGL